MGVEQQRTPMKPSTNVHNMAKTYNYFGSSDSAYISSNTFITNASFISHNNSENVSNMFHNHAMSGYDDTNESFLIRVEQCIDFLEKTMLDRNNTLSIITGLLN